MKGLHGRVPVFSNEKSKGKKKNNGGIGKFKKGGSPAREVAAAKSDQETGELGKRRAEKVVQQSPVHAPADAHVERKGEGKSRHSEPEKRKRIFRIV